MIIWVDGETVAAETARIDPRDRGFTLGDGLYETIRVQNRRPLRLDRHFARLGDGLRLLDISLPFGVAVLSNAIQEVLGGNALTDAAVRLTVTRGPAERGLAPDPAANVTIVISAASYPPPRPVRVVIATVTRRNEHSPLSRVKSTNCLDGILARIEAARRGADDAILLNCAGCVAETTAANVFVVLDGALATPPAQAGALPGTMRGWIIETAPVDIRNLTVENLRAAEEIFLTSSLGIRSVVALDGRALPAGPVAARLSELDTKTAGFSKPAVP
jgi:branched-chain amino acid aminotransferase